MCRGLISLKWESIFFPFLFGFSFFVLVLRSGVRFGFWEDGGFYFITQIFNRGLKLNVSDLFLSFSRLRVFNLYIRDDSFSFGGLAVFKVVSKSCEAKHPSITYRNFVLAASFSESFGSNDFGSPDL